MPRLGKGGRYGSQRVVEVSVDQLSPNPNQPRTSFSLQGLEELAQSIVAHGVLQPLSVRRLENGTYQLIAGERRLRAARLAGLSRVPCLVIDVGDEESSLLALVENLQRHDLDFLEEALAISQLVSTYRLTQEEVARRLGLSQSAIANKLRLLRLDPEALTLLRAKGFGERHARALLRLPEDAAQRAAAQYIVHHDLTVSATEDYISRLLLAQAAPPPRPKIILRDVRLFLNSLNRSLRLVQSAGITARCRREDTPEEIRLTITLPNRKEPSSRANVSRETSASFKQDSPA